MTPTKKTPQKTAKVATCDTCKYLREQMFLGQMQTICKRYPEALVKGLSDWCGEHST
jgi:hypothetical protein